MFVLEGMCSPVFVWLFHVTAFFSEGDKLSLSCDSCIVIQVPYI